MPVALLLLAIIAVVVTLVLLNANDKGDDPGLDVSNDPQAALVLQPPVGTIA